MLKYSLRRIVESIPTMIGVTVFTFILMHIVPGNPVRILLGNHYTAERAALLSHSLGLDKPLWQQYFIWLWNILHGNLQYSYTYDQSVLTLIGQALPHTLAIVFTSILFAAIFAVILGALQAYYENTLGDQIVTVINYFFYSMPSFWIALLLIIVFAIQLHWFPSGGIVDQNLANPGVGTYLMHMVLPAGALFLISVAGWSRYMRSSMREALLQDYVRTARMKGAGERRVVMVHAMRNSVLPIITLLGGTLPSLFAGALLIESVFNYPGMGLLYYHAISEYDYPIIMGITTIIGIVTVIGNLLADILYAVVDPRIQYR